MGSAIVGAIRIGLAVLARELSGGSKRAQNDLVRSSVESAQATRGVVAGPTNIPVFQVGQQLEDAMIETNGILTAILAAVQFNGASAAAGGVGGAGAPSGAAADLSLTTPSLI